VTDAAAALAPIARIVLDAVHREYPSHVSHYLESDADARPPRELTPSFFGSFDWHSAVHGHWSLARLARLFPGASFAPAAREALAISLQPVRLAGEAAYMSAPGRAGFERPYGLAWLLQLCAELREWNVPAAASWRAALEPLESIARAHLMRWLPRLPWPLRNGVHTQTAFSLGLVLDWTRAAGDSEMAALVSARARDWHLGDVEAPVAYEPSGHDFFSPALGEADLMRRVLAPAEFGRWLDGFLPPLGREDGARWLTPVTSPDPSDGHLAHLNGLNLSRSWMLEGVAAALEPADPRVSWLREAARRHGEAGLGAITSEHYAGAHWLGTYGVYYLTRRGLS